MTIQIENASKMVLRDDKHQRFVTAWLLVAGGLVLTFLVSRYIIVPMFAGLGLAAVGAFILLTTRRVTVVLDKTAGRIHVVFEGFKRKEERDLGMGQISKVVLRKLMQTSAVAAPRGLATARNYYQFTLVLVVDQKGELPFDFGQVECGITNLILSPDDQKREDAAQIASFIGAPLEVSLR
jgi:hypothetical protein